MTEFVNTRDKRLQQDDVIRIITNALYINSTGGAFIRPSDSTVYTPTEITLTAVSTGYVTPTYAWAYHNSSAPGVWTTIGAATTATYLITDDAFTTQLGANASAVTYRCIINETAKYTAIAYYTVTDSVVGVGPPTVYISKDNIVVPTDAFDNETYTNTGCTIQVIKDGTYLAATTSGAYSFSVSALGSSVTAGTPSYAGNTCTIGNISGATAGNTTPMSITYTITIRGAAGTTTHTITKTQTVTKSTAGMPAKYVTLASDSLVFSKTDSSDTTFAPTACTLTATAIGATVSTYAWTRDNTAVAGTSATLVVNATLPGTYKVLVTFTDATTASDQLTLVQLIGGSDSYNALLTNESHSVGCNSDGSAVDMSGASGTFLVYKGATAATGVVFSAATNASALAITLNTTTGVFSVAKGSWADGSSSATITFRAVVSGGPTIDKVFSLTKAYRGTAGAAGTNAKYVTLASDSLVFSKTDSSDTTFAPTACTLTATAIGATVSTYAWTRDNTAVAGTSATLVVNATLPGTYKVLVTFTDATTASDQLTLVQLIGGSDSYNALLTNESHSVVCNSDGSAVDMSGAIGTFLVYKGATAATGVVFSAATNASALAITLNTTTGVFSVAKGSWADGSSSATITFRAVVSGGPTIDKVFSLTKAYRGTAGTGGDKTVTIDAFTWALTTPGTPTAAVTYTWATNAYTPTTFTSGVVWSSSVSVAPGGQYSLYKASLLITGTAGATTTSSNWSSSRVFNTSGPGAVRAFVVTTSASAPSVSTALGSGYVPPTVPPAGVVTAWSFNATASILVGQWMYQVDGIYIPGGDITWGNAYLSNLKVGSLEAISATLGSVQIGVNGKLYSAGKTAYGSGSGAGVFLGYEASTYKFDVTGSSGSDYFRFNGTNVEMSGKIKSGTLNGMADRGGTTGTYLGSDGLHIIGDTSYDKFFRIENNGNVYTPAFNVVNGTATMSGVLSGTGVITTNNVIQNAISYAVTESLTSGTQTSITLTGAVPLVAGESPTAIYSVMIVASCSIKTTGYVTLVVSGTTVPGADPGDVVEYGYELPGTSPTQTQSMVFQTTMDVYPNNPLVASLITPGGTNYLVNAHIYAHAVKR